VIGRFRAGHHDIDGSAMTTPVEPQTPRFCRLFGTTEGLLVVAVAWEALIVAFLSLFSGPVRSLGLAGRWGIALGDTGRTGRTNGPCR